MAFEIEKKYLVEEKWREELPRLAERAIHIKQGYFADNEHGVVRVRIADTRAFLTIKGRNQGCKRVELEYPMPEDDARQMLSLCGDAVIEKTRYIIPYEGKTWEVDVFEGRHFPLILAEIELQTEDEEYSLPPFAGKDVTDDARYYNSNLARSGKEGK